MFPRLITTHELLQYPKISSACVGPKLHISSICHNIISDYRELQYMMLRRPAKT